MSADPFAEPWEDTELELRRELDLAERNMTCRHFDQLRSLGVDFDRITRAGGIGTLRVHPNGRSFTAAPSGDPAWILPVWHPVPPGLYSGIPRGEVLLIGLVAWRDEAAFWTREAGCSPLALGGNWFRRAAASGEPLTVCPGPLAWLRSGCTGYCPLKQDLLPGEAAAA